MTKKIKYTEDDIKSLSKKDWFKVRFLKNAKIDPLYVIIGFLQEYFGGYSLDKETVDGFFVDEYKKAKIFKNLCEHYLNTLNLENDIELIKVESGHSYVQSKLICEQLKRQFSIKEPDFLSHKRYTLSKDNNLFKSANELDKSQLYNCKRYSYLLGIIIKNKLEGKPEIVFANAGYKVKLAIDIINEFDAFGDESLRVDYYYGTPGATRITLKEDNIIWDEIMQFMMQIKNTDNKV